MGRKDGYWQILVARQRRQGEWNREGGGVEEDRTYSEYDFEEEEEYDSQYEYQEYLRQRGEYIDDEESEVEAQKERSACCCDQVLSTVANSIGGDGYDPIARSGDDDHGIGYISNEIGTGGGLSVDTQDHVNSKAIVGTDVLIAMPHNGSVVAASIGSAYDHPPSATC